MVTALYRRYRPETFAEMIGQSQVADPLMTALRTGRIGHAYLFSGPRGCGKTTSARILARCLNCVEGPTDTPCGECPSCVELSRAGGGSLDVVEIDAASHGGVDDARELRERAVFAPARDRYKIFIIDEAHMVTPGGFNALLKIVEEPPPHVKFVFATTEPEKVIGTIRSRTHHYPFRLVAPGPLIDYVQTLCDSEGVEVEAGVLPLVVRAGGGSVRDTLSILDQLIAGSEEGHVSLDRAAGLLGFTHTELLDEVVAALGAHDAAAAFSATDRVVQTGQDPRRFVEDLLQRLRDLIVVSATTVQGAGAVFRGVPEDQLQRMFEQAQLFGRGELSRVADTVSAALDRMAGATAPKLQLELMIARALLQAERHAAAAPAAAPQSTGAAAPAAPRSRPESAAPVSPDPRQPEQASSRAAASASHATAPTPSAQPTPAQSAPAQSTPAPATPAQTPPSRPAPTTPSGDTAEISAAEAMRAAREFLRTDTAGAASFGRPVTDVIGMMDQGESPKAPPTTDNNTPKEQSAPPATPATSPTSAPPAGVEHAAPPSSNAADAEVTFAELMEAWPDLLEELLESDREAWNAVREVTPHALDGDILRIGVASQSDLDVFKAAGAAPLREAILGALGITVRYVPMPRQSTPPGHTETVAQTPTGPQRLDPEREQPKQPEQPAQQAQPAPQSPPAPQTQPAPQSPPKAEAPQTSQPSAERASALGPVGAAPAWADYRPEAPVAAEDDPFEDSNSDPYQADEPTPAGEATPANEPTPVSEPNPAGEPTPTSEPPAVMSPAQPPQAPQPPQASPPEFTRYGEAVVREVLGARFVGEKPLSPEEGR